MSEPRYGDTILDARRMRPWQVKSVEWPHVHTNKPDGSVGRTFDLDRLECVDHDAGLWQEMAP